MLRRIGERVIDRPSGGGIVSFILSGRSPYRRPTHALILTLSLAALAITCIELTRGSGEIASVWVVNAVAVAVLMRCPEDERRLTLVALFAAVGAANLIIGDDAVQSIVFASCNLVEVGLVGAWVMRAHRSGDGLDSRAISRFIPAAVLAPLVSATGAAWWLYGAGRSFAATFVSCYIPGTLGLLMVTPVVLAVCQARRTIGQSRSPLETALFSLLTGAVTCIVFARSSLPLLFVLLPLLLLGSFRLRLTGALLTIAVTAAIAGAMTAFGHGPIAASAIHFTERVYILQAFIAAMVMLVLPVLAIIDERDRLDRAVRDSEQLFHRIAEASSTGVVYLDTAGKVTFANSRWAELTGCFVQDGGRFDLGAWVDPRDSATAVALWNHARTLNVPTFGDVRYVHPVDGPGWAELSFFPEAVGGVVRGLVVRATDVSRRCHAERALQTSEALYRLVAENSHDVIVRLDPVGRARYISSAARRLFGIEPGEFIGQPLARFVHGPDASALTSLFPAPGGASGQTTAQFRMRRKSGELIWVEVSAQLVADPDTGGAYELIASIRDIDLRRRSELVAAEAAAKLREGNRLLTLAETLAHIGHWRFDISTGELDCSPQFSVMVGATRDRALMARTLVDRVHAEDRRTVLRTLARARGHSGVAECPLRMVLDDGRVRHLRLIAQREVDGAGAAAGVFGIMRDVTAEKHVQAELIRARDAAEAAAVAKSNFLATMSHEIRTPMTGVLGMIDLLRASPGDEDRERYFTTLKQSADLLMAVLDDILDFSRIESGKIEFEARDFDIGELIQSTLDLFDGAASQKGILLSMDRRGIHTALVRGDPARVQQIVSNLLSNAIKFTDTGSVAISLASSPAGPSSSRWRIEVRDTGIGIAPDQIERLFEPFVQAEPGTARRFGGTGLGLAISRRIVDAMGGQIGVTSFPRRGATFWFEVDLPTGEPVTREADASSVVSSRRLDVLVAEDNPVNQMIISALLRRFGHAVTCVENGRLAVDIADARRFDCILMDMQMPELDGLAATRDIRGSNGASADAPIIALTADASPERRRFYNNAGLTDFLTKPIDRKILADRLAAIANELPRLAVRSPDPARQPDRMADLFDVRRYEELRAVLGDAQVVSLLDVLERELARQPDRIRAMIESGDYAGARAEAHSLHGAATNLGAIALGRIAEAIERSPDAQPIADQLDSLDDQARQTIRAIASLR